MLPLISESSFLSTTLWALVLIKFEQTIFFVNLTLFSPIWRGKEGRGGLFFKEMTLRGNTGQACAACKFQRRKCTPECPLAPYFPPDQPKTFRNVHRLFGVKKVQKLLEELPVSQHNEAMSSIIYQAEIRDRFPVFGCVEVIQVLKAQIQQCQEELYAVHSMLAMYQQQQLHLGVGPVSTTNNNEAPLLYLPNPMTVVPPQAYSPENAIPCSDSSSNSPNDSSYPGIMKETLVNSLWIQQPFGNDSNNTDNDNSLPIQSQLLIPHSPSIQPEAFEEYNAMHPYLDAIDDRQSYVDSHEVSDSRY